MRRFTRVHELIAEAERQTLSVRPNDAAFFLTWATTAKAICSPAILSSNWWNTRAPLTQPIIDQIRMIAQLNATTTSWVEPDEKFIQDIRKKIDSLLKKIRGAKPGQLDPASAHQMVDSLTKMDEALSDTLILGPSLAQDVVKQTIGQMMADGRDFDSKLDETEEGKEFKEIRKAILVAAGTHFALKLGELAWSQGTQLLEHAGQAIASCVP